MEGVAERVCSGKRNIPDRMASDAITLDREACLAVVTGAARLALFHLFHGDMRVFTGLGIKKLVVAISTGIKAQMELMVKKNGPEIGNIDRYLIDNMAPHALRNMKSTGLVVTVAAGLAFFHFGHRNNRNLLADLIKGAMAYRAIVCQLLYMNIVIEDDLTGIVGIEGHFLVVLGKQEKRGGQQQQSRHEEAFQYRLLAD